MAQRHQAGFEKRQSRSDPHRDRERSVSLLFLRDRLADKRCASSVLPIAQEKLDQVFHDLWIVSPVRRNRFGGQVGIRYLAGPEVGIAKHVEQFRSHGSGFRQLLRRIGIVPLVVPDLAHLGNRQLIIRVVSEFRLKLILSPVQVALFQRQNSLIGMGSANGWLNFQRMMKTAQSSLRVCP